MIDEVPISEAEFHPSAATSQQLPLGTLRRAQFAVGMLFLVNGGVVGSWVPHIPERAHALGLNTAQLGAVLLASGIGALTAMPLSGPLQRRFGSRRIASIVGLLFPALLSLAILLPSVPVLVAVLWCGGLCAAAMDVAMNAHGVLVEELMKRRTISLFHAIFSVGCFVGAGTHSVLMARHVADAILVPGFAGVLLVLVLCVLPFLLPQAVERAHYAEHRDPHIAAAGDEGKTKSWRSRLPHPRLLLLGSLCFCSMVNEGAMGDWSALFLRVVRHLPNGINGYGYTAYAAFMVTGRFLGDTIAARIGEGRVLRGGGLLAATGLLLVLLAKPLPLALLGFALVGAGIANGSPILYRTAGTLPGFAPGTAIATAVGVGYAGLLIGPPLLGLLAHVAGLPSVFWVLLVLSLTLAIASTAVLRGTQGSRRKAAGETA